MMCPSLWPTIFSFLFPSFHVIANCSHLHSNPKKTNILDNSFEPIKQTNTFTSFLWNISLVWDILRHLGASLFPSSQTNFKKQDLKSMNFQVHFCWFSPTSKALESLPPLASNQKKIIACNLMFYYGKIKCCKCPLEIMVQ
jgi:hypothetical protein